MRFCILTFLIIAVFLGVIATVGHTGFFGFEMTPPARFILAVLSAVFLAAGAIALFERKNSERSP